jgi:lysophospholipase
MLSSLVQHDFPKLGDLVLGNVAAGTEGWALDKDIFAPGTPNQQKVFAAEIFADLIAKRSAGFAVSFGDFWARALSYHFLPGTTSANFFTKDAPNHAAALTFSSVTSLPAFQNHLAPFPIIVGDAYSVNRFPGDVGYVPLTRTVYEVSRGSSPYTDGDVADYWYLPDQSHRVWIVRHPSRNLPPHVAPRYAAQLWHSLEPPRLRQWLRQPGVRDGSIVQPLRLL